MQSRCGVVPRWLNVAVARTWVHQRALGIAVAASVTACAPAGPVTWADGIQALPDRIDDGSVLALTGPQPTLVPAAAMAYQPDAAVCAGSVRLAADGQGGWYAAWWSPRTDSSVALLVARRVGPDSAWSAPVIADARDRGHRGCARPAPAIAADAARKYVHLAYHLDAPTGAGVYGGHSMESGTYFHDPVAIVYGDRTVAASIATSGDNVVVAYEDPNSARPRIALAVSRSAGHLYDARVEVTPSSMRATSPRVAIRGDRIAVAWTAGEGEADTRTMARLGTLDPAPATAGGSDQ
jgi:hypothetical protein